MYPFNYCESFILLIYIYCDLLQLFSSSSRQSCLSTVTFFVALTILYHYESCSSFLLLSPLASNMFSEEYNFQVVFLIIFSRNFNCAFLILRLIPIFFRSSQFLTCPVHDIQSIHFSNKILLASIFFVITEHCPEFTALLDQTSIFYSFRALSLTNRMPDDNTRWSETELPCANGRRIRK